MERMNFKLAASAVMIMCAANGAQAVPRGQQEVNAQSNHNSRSTISIAGSRSWCFPRSSTSKNETVTLQRAVLRQEDADRLLRDREDEGVALRAIRKSSSVSRRR